MGDLFVEALGVLPALLIVLCQPSLGMYCNNRFNLGLSFIAQWVVGMAALGILNFFFLLGGLGQLIHLNIFALLLLDLSKLKTLSRSFKPFLPCLLFFFVLLFLSSVLNPVIEWDAQASYLGLANHWALNKDLMAPEFFSTYDLRPQFVSLPYLWGLTWGNESTCQALDLFFFLGFLSCVSQQLKLNSSKLLLLLLVSTPIANFRIWEMLGVAGNEFIVYLFLMTMFEVLLKMQKKDNVLAMHFLWLLLTMAFLNIRWNCGTLYALLFVIFVFVMKGNKKYIPTLILAPFLCLGWYYLNFELHKNPVYPYEVERFASVPSNAYLRYDFSREGLVAWKIGGVRSLQDFWQFCLSVGWVILIYPMTFFVDMKKSHKPLFFLAFVHGFISSITTAQVKFQIFSLMVLGGLLIVSRVKNPRHVLLKYLFLGSLCLLALPALSERFTAVFSVFRDARHGKEYLMEERIRLYPAARWLNQQEDKKARVLWPMNPHYYCELPTLRADNAAYLLPDEILNDSALVADYLIDELKVKWIVKASPYYDSTFQSVKGMIGHVQWISENDDRWYLAIKIEAIGVSPEIEIFALKTEQISSK